MPEETALRRTPLHDRHIAAGAAGAGSTDVLYRLADRAAYRAKGQGGGHTEVSQAA